MLRSLFSGITGLRAHQTMIDVTSNNIANVNTTGYKSGSLIFSDTLSQLIKAASAATANSGGTNPAQVGLGVQVSGISNNFTQGSSQSTGINTNLMIQGDGFFIVKDGNTDLYTRAGAFKFDATGYLVNDSGQRVQGFTAVGGVVNVDGVTSDIQIPSTTTLAPQETANVVLTGNLESGTTGTLTTNVDAYDSAGVTHTLTITVDKSTGALAVTDSVAGATATAGSVTFNADGSINTSTDPTITLADGSVVTVDVTGLTKYGSEDKFNVLSVDGYGSGNLNSLEITTTGEVVGSFTNGQKITLAQLALATFNNPAGLEKVGDTAFEATTNSGLAIVTTPDNGAGSLVSGAVEMSNVDLGTEFSNLIIAQRGFQANSKVITTSDSILDELVNMKR